MLLCGPVLLRAATTAPTATPPRVNLEDSTRWTYSHFAAGTIFDLLDAAPDTGVRMPPGAPLELAIDFVAWLAPAQIELRVGSQANVDFALYTAGTNGLCAARPAWSATLTDCAANVQLSVPISMPATGRWLRLRLEPRRDDTAVVLDELAVFGVRGVTNVPTWPTRAFAQAEQLVARNATNAAYVIARSLAPTALRAPARDGYPAGVFWYLLYTRALELQGKPRDGFDTLKECMTLYPLDAALVENDPVFALYVDRLGAATETELCGFYDALGTQLELIPPVQGNESALALCANERTLLTRLFPFLTKEDDMARIRAIISAKAAARAHAQAAP